MNNKIVSIITALLLSSIISNGYAQCTTSVTRKDSYSYEVFSEITFPGKVAGKLWVFCWDINNITRILSDKPVSIGFSEMNSVQTISYDYEFLFFNYYSEYERKKQLNDSIISFKLLRSECSIPFIPNLKNVYGSYTITSGNKTSTVQYYQYAETDGVLRDFYYNYIKKDIEGFFNSFEIEFNKTLKNANY